MKVAKATDPLKIQSPLDRLNGLSKSTCETQTSVSSSQPTFQLSFHFRQNSQNQEKASRNPIDGSPAPTDVTIGIRKSDQPDERPLFLTGIKATKVRDGWFNLTIPPLESWDATISALNPADRAKIESPKFFALLQSEIPIRLSQL